VKRLERSVLTVPNAPVSEIVGKYSDLATPMRALAAMSVCSARRMSGRRSSSSDGTPAGTAGRISASRGKPRGMGPGLRPSSTLRAFSVWPIARSMSGRRASASSYSDSAWLKSTSEMIPFWKRSSNNSRVPLRLSAVRWVISNCLSSARMSK